MDLSGATVLNGFDPAGNEYDVVRRGQGTEPEVSIIIPVFNKAEVTARCLHALVANTGEVAYEVVIVDNASTDETPILLDALDDGVVIIRNSKNLGYTLACNQGAREASGKVLVFLNNDTEPQPGWLSALLDALGSDPSVGAVGGMLVYPDGRVQEAGGIVFADGSGWNFGRFASPDDPLLQQPCDVDYVSGACLAIEADLFRDLGGFDERYAPAYYEDTDLCFKVRAAGRRVRYEPRCRVVHHEGVTAGTDLSSGFKRFQSVNQATFARKWERELAVHEPIPALVGPPARADRAMRMPGFPAVEPPDRSGLLRLDRPARILVVDPFLPLHDQASGSLRLYRLLEAACADGHEITYLARTAQGQDRYRRDVERLGIEVIAGDPDRMAALGHQIDAPRIDVTALVTERRFDLAILSFYEIAEQYLPLIRRAGTPTIVAIDTVDVHFLRERRGAAVLGDAAAYRSSEMTRLREIAAYRQGDVLIAVTDEDAEWLRALVPGADVVVMPNVHCAQPGPRDPKDRHGLVFVGNFRHPPNVDAATFLVRELLPGIRARAGMVPLSIVGVDPPPSVQRLAGDGVTVTGFVPSTRPFLDAARVSVAPLRFGAGMKGKVGEALAAGLPVVTTPIGAEGMGATDGGGLLVAEDPEAFVEQTVRLLHDDDLWTDLAHAGPRWIEACFGPHVCRERLRSLVSRPLATAAVTQTHTNEER